MPFPSFVIYLEMEFRYPNISLLVLLSRRPSCDPHGLLADRIGRKPTVCLSIPGFLLNGILIVVPLWFSNVIPLRAVWLSPLAWFIGGGPVVAFATLWTMMADVTTNEERYVRCFFER